MIWYGKGIEDICPEETFRYLVELAFSLEPGSRYKTSLNSLLCSLCCVNPEHFSLLLASCEDVLLGEPERVGHRLNTLAGAAQSLHCTQVLLGSKLVTKMISRLTNGFEKLLDLAYDPVDSSSGDPVKTGARGMVSSLCSLLAFFTDFFRNWRPGKEWMAGTDSHRFWLPMIEFLSMDSPVVPPLEASFIQEVAFNFFSMCLFGCDLTKRLFTQLVCNFLHNQVRLTGGGGGGNGSDGASSDPVLTPFLHKLMVGLVFQHECVPLILKFVSPPEQTGGENSAHPLSLPSTCEVLEFHPSYPIGEACYYLHVPGSFSLAQFEALLRSHKTGSTVKKPELPKRPEKSSQKKSILTAKSIPGKIPLVRLPPQPATAVTDASALNVANFKLVEWKLSAMSKDDSKSNNIKEASTLSFYLLNSDIDEEEEAGIYRNFLFNYAKQDEDRVMRLGSEPLRGLVPLGANYPMVVVVDSRAMFFGAENSTVTQPDNMYDMFVSYEGPISLAKSMPGLYPYLWPSSLITDTSGARISSSDTGSSQQQLFKPHSILGPPSATSFRSVVMLGVCLQLEGYGRVLGENSSAAYLLMRLLLGEDIGVRGQSVCYGSFF